MFVLIMGAIGSKSRAPGQILEKKIFTLSQLHFWVVHSNSGERCRAIMALLYIIFIPGINIIIGSFNLHIDRMNWQVCLFYALHSHIL